MADTASLKGRIEELINSKRQIQITMNRGNLNWKHSELKIINQCTDDVALKLIETLEHECVKNKIPSFYSYFILQKIVKIPDSLFELQKQIVQIQQSKSKYQSIKSYIKMREHLLSKINQFTGNNIKNLFEDIEDIRFLNFQIVTGIVNWKKSWKVEDAIEPVFYEDGVNYLLKISNDNADMINLANFKKTKFISPPNPFFLSEDGNLQGMSQKQKENISECMEVITRQRAIDLKMIIQGGHFTGKVINRALNNTRKSTSKSQKLENSLIRQAKNEMLSVKQQQIKKIYKINKSLSQAKRKIHSQKQQEQIHLRKMSHQQKKIEKEEVNNSSKVVQRKRPVEKIINRKSSIDKIKPRQDIVKLAIDMKQRSKQQQNLEKKIVSKIRDEVDKRLNSVSSSEMKTNTLTLREVKPKIKLVEQKQTVVDSIKSGFVASTAYASERPLSRKNTSFYKIIVPIIEQADDNQNSQIKPAKQLKQKSLTQYNFNLKKSSITSILPEKVVKQSKVQNTDERYQSKEIVDLKKSKVVQQISNLKNSLKNLTIINIYKGKKRTSRRERSVSTYESPQPMPRRQVSSFITELSPKEGQNVNYESVNQTKIKKKYELSEERLKKQLLLHLTKNQKGNKILQERESHRKSAEMQLQQKNQLIMELQKKIKVIDNKKEDKLMDKKQLKDTHQRLFEREKKKSEIQSKILKDHLKKQQERFLSNRKMQLKLKQEQFALQFNQNIKKLKLQNQKKQKQYQQLLMLEKRRSKETELLIKKEENRVKNIEMQLAQKMMKEDILRKIIEKKEQSERESRLESQEQMGKRLQKQLMERQQMQKEGLALIEVQKQRISALYLELKEKNKKIEQQNQKKQKELMKINEQRQLQRQDVVKMQKQLLKSQSIEKQQQTIIEGDVGLEEMKSKIKQELLIEILKRQEEEEREEQIQQERRKKRLKKIEEEVANALRQEEEELDRQNSQFLRRVEVMKERYAIASNLSVTQSLHLAESALQEKKGQQQRQDRTQRQQNYQSKIQGVEQQNMSSNVMKDQLLIKQKMLKQTERQHQQKTEILFKDEQELSQNKTIQPVTMQIQSHHLSGQVEEQNPIIQLEKKSLEEQQVYNELLILQAKQIQQKYNNLKKYFRRTRQLSVKDLNVSIFLDNFYSHLQKYVKEMLPWSRIELEQRIGSKQVDLFDSNSLGWLEQNNIYNLIGGIECVQTIFKKYGSVQIYQVFHFNRNNPYQKQVLAKKIKFFQNIGYVYQKKIHESTNFSIKFVIKIPKSMGQQSKIQKIINEDKVGQQN